MSVRPPTTDVTYLFVSHDRGGGIAHHMEQLADMLADRVQVAILLSQPGHYVKLRLASHEWYFHQENQFQDLLEILRGMRVACVHFHHFWDLLPTFWQLPQMLDIPYRITLHDYNLVNGVTTLSDEQGFFLQDPALQCEPSRAKLPPWCVSLHQWQQMNTVLLNAAEQVFCPSLFIQEVYREYYPDARYRQCYHPDWELDAPYPAVKSGPARKGSLRVGILGMLSREKGADRLEECAVAMRERSLEFEFVLFGEAYRRLNDSVATLGPYEDRQLAGLVAEQGIDLVWFPALCAETYSYTLSHCLRQGLPVFAPDVGAFSERLRGRPLSFLYPYRCGVDTLINQLEVIREKLLGTPGSVPWEQQALPQQQAFLYARDYQMGIPVPPEVADYKEAEFDRFSSVPLVLRLSRGSTRLLAWLLRYRDSRVLAFLQRIIPYGAQKWIKRKLSHKPLHELRL